MRFPFVYIFSMLIYVYLPYVSLIIKKFQTVLLILFFQVELEPRTSTAWSTATISDWSWRRSSITAVTLPSGEKLNWPIALDYQKDR